MRIKKKKNKFKQRRLNRDDLKLELNTLVKKYGYKIPHNEMFLSEFFTKKYKSWFDVDTMNHYHEYTPNFKQCQYEEDKVIKCQKLSLLPTDKQKSIMILWLHSYRIMYNKTIHYFRTAFFHHNKVSKSFKYIRTYILKKHKQKIIDKYNTPSHILDGAIKLACASYKSCLTNLKNGNIKHFKLNYMKSDKKTLIMDIEQCYLNENSICPKWLGKELKNKDNMNYSSIIRDCKIHYSSITKRFTLLIPEDVPIIDNNSEEYVAIDPGVRTFLTGVGNKVTFNFGTNIREMMKPKLERLDKIKTNRNKRIYKRYELAINKSIKNKIEDLHWKAIDYLTNKFKTIVIGNWSTKRIGEGQLDKMTKRIATRLCYYKFLQRLKYKSQSKNINLLIVDESYTSKMCSYCGHINEHLRGSKTLNCHGCNMRIDRDINGARNIMMKGILSN